MLAYFVNNGNNISTYKFSRKSHLNIHHMPAWLMNHFYTHLSFPLSQPYFTHMKAMQLMEYFCTPAKCM